MSLWLFVRSQWPSVKWSPCRAAFCRASAACQSLRSSAVLKKLWIQIRGNFASGPTTRKAQDRLRQQAADVQMYALDPKQESTYGRTPCSQLICSARATRLAGGRPAPCSAVPIRNHFCADSRGLWLRPVLRVCIRLAYEELAHDLSSGRVLL